MYSSSHVVAAGACDVNPADVLDAQPGAIAPGTAVYARRDVNWLVDVVELHVGEGHIAHPALARVCFDPCGVAAVKCGDVIVVNVLDIVGLRRV